MSAVATASPPAPPTPAVPSHEPRPRTWTRDEYYRLADLGFFAGQRVERIDGKVVEMSPMNQPHIQGVLLALDALRSTFGPGHTLRPQLPLPLGEPHDPEPDIAIVPGGPRDPLTGPATVRLIVEVADTSLAYDTTTKAVLYATAGIADYWVVDLAGRVVYVFRDPAPLPDGTPAYRTRTTVAPGETIVPVHAPAGTSPVPVDGLLP